MRALLMKIMCLSHCSVVCFACVFCYSIAEMSAYWSVYLAFLADFVFCVLIVAAFLYILSDLCGSLIFLIAYSCGGQYFRRLLLRSAVGIQADERSFSPGDMKNKQN